MAWLASFLPKKRHRRALVEWPKVDSNGIDMPSLYVVATPIGNLEDLSLRALRVLGEVGLIAAEDTRVTRKLLGRYDISTPLTSYHQHNRWSKLPRLLESLASHDVALVSDAGMPGVNDPGTRKCRPESVRRSREILTHLR